MYTLTITVGIFDSLELDALLESPSPKFRVIRRDPSVGLTQLVHSVYDIRVHQTLIRFTLDRSRVETVLLARTAKDWHLEIPKIFQNTSVTICCSSFGLNSWGWSVFRRCRNALLLAALACPCRTSSNQDNSPRTSSCCRSGRSSKAFLEGKNHNFWDTNSVSRYYSISNWYGDFKHVFLGKLCTEIGRSLQQRIGKLRSEMETTLDRNDKI